MATDTVEVTQPVASQNYECDLCLHDILDETQYVRVAKLAGRTQLKRDVRAARSIEKYHPECARTVGYLK